MWLPIVLIFHYYIRFHHMKIPYENNFHHFSLLHKIPPYENNLSILPPMAIRVYSVQFSRWVVSDSLQPHGLQHTTSLSVTNSRSLLKLMSMELVMTFNHLILCHPLLLLPSIFPSIKVFSNESVLHIRWPKDWSFSFSISPSNEHPGLISFRMDWLDLLPCTKLFYMSFAVSELLLASLGAECSCFWLILTFYQNGKAIFVPTNSAWEFLFLCTIMDKPLSRVQLFVAWGTAPRQASLSFTVSWSLLKFMSIESVMLSNMDKIYCLYSPWNSPDQNTGVDRHSLLQIFPAQGIKPRSPSSQVDSLPAEPTGKPIV